MFVKIGNAGKMSCVFVGKRKGARNFYFYDFLRRKKIEDFQQRQNDI